jgi:hypothetical protein
MTVREAYAALGLDPSSTTPPDVRSRFRELIHSNHPDGKPSHEQAEANEATRVIVEACTLLRRQGIPRITAGAAGAAFHYEKQAVAEAASADPLAWVDEVLRESLRGYVAGVMSLTFGVHYLLSAWTFGYRIMRR